MVVGADTHGVNRKLWGMLWLNSLLYAVFLTSIFGLILERAGCVWFKGLSFQVEVVVSLQHCTEVDAVATFSGRIISVYYGYYFEMTYMVM